MARTTFLRFSDNNTNIAVWYGNGDICVGLHIAHRQRIGGYERVKGGYIAYVNLTGGDAPYCYVTMRNGEREIFPTQETAALAVAEAYAVGQALGALADLCRKVLIDAMREELAGEAEATEVSIEEDGEVRCDGVRCGQIVPHNGGYVARLGAYDHQENGEYVVYSTQREAARAVVDLYAAGQLVSAVRSALYPIYIDMAKPADFERAKQIALSIGRNLYRRASGEKVSFWGYKDGLGRSFVFGETIEKSDQTVPINFDNKLYNGIRIN